MNSVKIIEDLIGILKRRICYEWNRNWIIFYCAKYFINLSICKSCILGK